MNDYTGESVKETEKKVGKIHVALRPKLDKKTKTKANNRVTKVEFKGTGWRTAQKERRKQLETFLGMRLQDKSTEANECLDCTTRLAGQPRFDQDIKLVENLGPSPGATRVEKKNKQKRLTRTILVNDMKVTT